ncbi:sperm-associated antigen 5 [Salvelinus fontinalis]|uniref:sperm-associated antigen 5 n=1 Tax=Salvelinus fontinalis TaxID=8038 RepID=UPI002485F1DE|nr:sperm-associated antigen 5 [Salvelinus fontinalis]
MSTRRSHTFGETMPSTRSGERTPLRCVQNEMRHLSTPSSRLKSRSGSGNILKTPKNDAVFIYTDPLTHCPPPPEVLCSPSVPKPSDKTTTSDTVPTAEDTAVYTSSGLGDITFKSFICAGGEVEVSEPSRVVDETIRLPKNQLNISSLPCYDVDNTCLSDSMVTQCCDNHVDHVYCDLESDLATTEADLSFNGGSNASLSVPQFTDIAHITETVTGGQGDVTFKSFICTGGEVEVSEASRVALETILLPTDQPANHHQPYNGSIYQSVIVDDLDMQSIDDHADHLYCNMASSSAHLSFKEPTHCSLQNSTLKSIEMVHTNEESTDVQNATGGQGHVTFKSICTGLEVEVSESTRVSEDTILLPENQTSHLPYNDRVNPNIIEEQFSDHAKHPYSHVDSEGAVWKADTAAISEPSMGNASLRSLKDLGDVACQLFPEGPKQGSSHDEDSAVVPSIQLETDRSHCNEFGASARSSTPVDEDNPSIVSHSRSHGSMQESSGARDSAPLLSNTTDEASSENIADVLTELPKIPSVARWAGGGDALQFEIFSPVLSTNSMTRRGGIQKSSFAQLEDSALENGSGCVLNSAEGSFVVPANPDSRLWAAVLESPMPLPKFNSTAVGAASTRKPPPSLDPVTETVETRVEVEVPHVKSQPKVEKVEMGLFDHLPRLVCEKAFQQQLIQMAQFLILASGKMDPVSNPALAPTPAPPVVETTAGTTAVECHSMCVGTTPVRQADRSANTSGQFERKREFSVSDACTSTETLLWNLAPGSLCGVPRQELEQRLTSTLIMVEALVQQLCTARGQGHSRGPGPSELRDKLVQTDHTELSQTVTYKDLYVTALERINELELDQTTLHNLLHSMQDTRSTMTALSGDTEAALSSMRQIRDLVKEDQQSLVTQYGQMKSLYEKCKETQGRMVQKVRDTLQQREDMRRRMEEAYTAKDAAFSVTEQLRTHCAVRISELEESVGSHQELMAALNKTYSEQVALNKAYVESLNSASELLRGTMSDHDSLHQELKTARRLLQRTTPILVKLNEKAANAIGERDQHLSERDQAVEAREQIQEELDQTNVSLQDARQEIGDLNLQATIMNSELGVLRQKLSEEEEERVQLERKVTELSATVSSTLASYAFLEQALAAESTKLQQSWQEVQQATDRANQLEGALVQSEQRVCELSQALAHSEEQLSQLQSHSHSQSMQLQMLHEVRVQLNSMMEMNEFLQMENDMAREQVVESEGTLRANLQGLRERNIQCEDLKGALSHLHAEREALQAELEDSQARAQSVQLDLVEQLAQAVTDVTLLHHTLRRLTNDVHTALTTKKPEVCGKDEVSQPSLHVERHPSTSFVDSIMVAITTDLAQANDTQPPLDMTEEPQAEGLGSETSAFTRLAPITPKKCQVVPPEEEQSSVVELLADLANTVSELSSTITQLRQSKDTEQEALNNTICRLQGEQQAQAHRHRAEVSELRGQLSRLQTQLGRDQVALQNKAQEVDTMKRICSEVNEAREFLYKHKSENKELRREVADLRRSLHQSQVESQALREELRNTGNQSAHSMHSMDDKIRLLKEVERLKRTLLEAEEGRAKLLERAKRHQMIHDTNQKKVEKELRVLDDMIETVRKTLSSVPDVVKNCKELKTLVEYLG